MASIEASYIQGVKPISMERVAPGASPGIVSGCEHEHKRKNGSAAAKKNLLRESFFMRQL